MSMHRKNKDSGQGNVSYNAAWFVANNKRTAKRRKLAKASRKRNRR